MHTEPLPVQEYTYQEGYTQKPIEKASYSQYYHPQDATPQQSLMPEDLVPWTLVVAGALFSLSYALLFDSLQSIELASKTSRSLFLRNLDANSLRTLYLVLTDAHRSINLEILEDTLPPHATACSRLLLLQGRLCVLEEPQSLLLEQNTFVLLESDGFS
ncbi:Uncharacterised protein [Chlamydia trachomatis]|nr:Uncharacterised protein [Chlamydia trachomatis]